MKKMFVMIATLFIFLGTSCTQKDEQSFTELYIDFESVETLDLLGKPEVNMEMSDSSLIKRIDELQIIGNKFFIRSTNDLLLFDHDGAFKNKIGNRGAGPNEFTHFNSFFIKDNHVHIYDAMTKKMYLYEFDGSFIESVSLSDEYNDIIPNLIYPIQNDRFISKNTFGGDHRKIPTYSILNSDYTIKSNINGRYLKNGITTLNNFFCNDDLVFFWELLNDTIFSVKNDTTYEQKYFVNFNKRALPHSIKKLDLYDAIELSNKAENASKYASAIRNVNEDKSYLHFTFIFDRENYYVKYNKNNKKLKAYRITYEGRTIEPIICLADGLLFIPVNMDDNPDLNPSIVIVSESTL